MASLSLRRMIAAVGLIGLLGAGAEAQPLSWLELTIERPGVYTLDAATLEGAGLKPKSTQLVGPEGAIEAVASGAGLRFFAAPPPPWKKIHVIARPLHGDEERLAGAEPAAFQAEVARALRFENGTVYAPDSTEDRKKLRSPTAPEAHYWLLAEPARRVEVACRLPRLAPITEAQVKLEIDLTPPRDGRGCARAAIALNDHAIGEFDLPRARGLSTLSLRVPKGFIELDPQQPNTIVIEGVGRGVIRVHAIRFELPVALDDARTPTVRKVAPPRLPANCEYLVIVADGCEEAVGPLLAHREAQGLKVGVARLSEVYRAHGAGNASAAAIRVFVNARRQDATPARYILLVGDASGTRGGGGVTTDLPSPLVDTHGNGASASDNVYVAGTDGSTPTAAIGRFPTSDPAVVCALVARTIAYETESDQGPWRRRLNMLAGEGRFGPQIDQAIENLATRIFAEHVPARYELTMTYASARSPYLFVPERLGAKVIDRVSEGALFVSYTGHGHKEGFDSLRWKGRRYPILALADVPKVHAAPGRRPIVTITACWTGAFDDPELEPVGEALFEHADGPIAVLAASRVSHPLPNALLSKELVSALFDWEGEAPRLGDMIVSAKKATMTGQDSTRQMILGTAMMFLGDALLMNRLIADNMHLYSLLGDPALRVAFPEPDGLVLSAKRAGGKVSVRGKLTGSAAKELSSGRAIVTLEVPRDKFVTRPAAIDLDAANAAEQIEARYNAANDKALVRVEVDVRKGAFTAELDVPGALPEGTYFVKALCWNDGKTVAGAEILEVKRED